MKLVDILFVLSAAATANAILIPTGNDRSTHTSGTSSRVSVSTNEPNPAISNDWQEPMDLSLPGRIRQQPMDQPNPNTFNQGQRPTATVAGPSTFKQGRKRIMDVIDLLISRQNQQRPIDEVDPNASKQSQQQQPTDIAGPSTPKRSRKRPIDEIRPSIFSQASGSTNEPSPSAPKQNQQQPIDQPIPSTSSQDQQQPMGQGESSNTASNRVIILSQKYQETLDGLKQGLVASKKIQKKKRQEYNDHTDLGLEQQSALAMGEDISGSTYNPKTEIRLKQEYEKASKRVYNFRQRLKDFMKEHGLRFQEPDSDSD
ncbi:hypothetical protein O5D80_008195 [Batrachochytrium dendrobatidis]|nr:hypothetical protein O5D80_008195 [Batrachochytrium dendrobatidis]